MNRSQRAILVFSLFFLLSAVVAQAAGIVTDRAGRRIEVGSPFQRIISLYPAHTENLFSLGLDQQIVGVGRGDDFPPAALKKPRFSYRGDAERILVARPDLVLIRPMIERGYPNLVRKLEEAGVTVVSLQPTTVEEIFAYWRKLGVLTGKEREAERMIRDFQGGLKKIARVVETIPARERKRVYFEAIHRRMKTFAPSSMAVFVLTRAGGVNVAQDARTVRKTNIAAYGKERILAHADEIDVFLAQQGAMNRVDRRTIVEEPGFQAIKAVRKGEIFLVDEKIVSRPTLRLLKGIRTVGHSLYPDRFPAEPGAGP